MIGLIIRLIRLIITVGVNSGDHPEPEVSDALFTRQARTGAEYLKMAADAMIYEGKTQEQIKELLRNQGMYEDNINLYAKKAKEQYDKWIDENGGPPDLTAMEQYERLHKQKLAVYPSIKLGSVPEENHAHHFCALVGKGSYYTETGRIPLYGLTTAALRTAPVLEQGNATIRQLTFQQYDDNASNPYLRVLSIDKRQEAVYPYLKTEKVVPFQTKKIIEWEQDNPFEAEIECVWNGLSLGFYATDYAVKKQTYRLKQEINIRLSAFLLSVSVADSNSGKTKDKEYKPRYEPNPAYGHFSYFVFDAILLRVATTNLSKTGLGYIFTLKLIDNYHGSDLIVDAYVNDANIKGENISKEMRLTGTLWFQAELAD